MQKRKSNPPPKSAKISQPLPSKSPTERWETIKVVVSILALIVSILALIIAFQTNRSQEQVRLDVTRNLVRSKSSEVVRELRSAITKYNCYAEALGRNTYDKERGMAYVVALEALIREKKSKAKEMSPTELDEYEKQVDGMEGVFTNTLNDELVLLRSTSKKELLEIADSKCKL